MNAIFITQGSRFELFYRIMLRMNDYFKFENVGFYVTDSRFFHKFVKEEPEIENGTFSILKEWDIIKNAEKIKPDFSILKSYEEEIGDPYLWNTIVADRNIYNGINSALAQDYSSRFSHENMLSILQIGAKKLDYFINEIQPDFIISFQCITIGEYLSCLFARAKNIPFLNIRPTRISNYIYAGEDIKEPSENLYETYKNFYALGIENMLEKEVDGYLKTIINTNTAYEGVILPSNKSPYSFDRKRGINILKILRTIFHCMKNDISSFINCNYKYDNSFDSHTKALIYHKMIMPLVTRKINNKLKERYVNIETLENYEYVFFPLHTEPEVTLNVYNKEFLNQIEAIRLISHNLPVGLKLIVKEHPCSLGKRPYSYYRKILEIPNVLLASPDMLSRDLINHATLIAVISGSIGLEAVFLKKPVITLGNAPFNYLPNTMLMHIEKPNELSFEINKLIRNYIYDEKAVKSYIASVINQSVPVDFYSILSRRKEAYNPKIVDVEMEREKQLNLLAKYLVQMYHKYASRFSST